MAIRVIVRLTPAKPKAGEEFRLQAVAQHPNEPGTRRDERGQPHPRQVHQPGGGLL
jgi:sulfur-oxidizing protein SoxZ